MPAKLTKQEAVRRALAHFGNDAKPSQMQGWIKEQLGIEMSTNHVSTAKGSILKAAKGGLAKRKPGRPPSAKTTEPEAAASPARTKPAAGPKKGGIPLDDILYVKGLVGRFGPEQLHTLTDAFAR